MASARQKKIQMVKEEAKVEINEAKVEATGAEVKADEALEVGFEVVELISEGNDKKGSHNIYLKRGYANFVDGVAKVRNELAAELRELGLVK